jgi:hypothetical protein
VVTVGFAALVTDSYFRSDEDENFDHPFIRSHAVKLFSGASLDQMKAQSPHVDSNATVTTPEMTMGATGGSKAIKLRYIQVPNDSFNKYVLIKKVAMQASDDRKQRA